MGGFMITSNSHMNPVYGKSEINGVNEYMNSNAWIMEYSETRKMEGMICDYTGAKYAHMVPSATMGLMLCSILSKITHGENFDTSAYTQAATANGSILMGGIPNIIDVDPRSYTIDFESINNRVVYITSINGRTPDNYDEQIKKLKIKGHFVIEDAAQALGSWHKNNHIGTMGHVGVFSFGAPKIITTGQGGCVITNNNDISNQIIAIKNFGRTVDVGETYNTFGMNFKFTDLQASFGVEQMKKLPKIIQRKKEIFDLYRKNLEDIVDFVYTDLRYVTPTYPEILINNRDELYKYLRDNHIGCRAVYSSLSKQPFHSQWSKPSPITDSIADRGLQLPGQSDLTDDDIMKICDIIKKKIGE